MLPKFTVGNLGLVIRIGCNTPPNVSGLLIFTGLIASIISLLYRTCFEFFILERLATFFDDEDDDFSTKARLLLCFYFWGLSCSSLLTTANGCYLGKFWSDKVSRLLNRYSSSSVTVFYSTFWKVFLFLLIMTYLFFIEVAFIADDVDCFWIEAADLFAII